MGMRGAEDSPVIVTPMEAGHKAANNSATSLGILFLNWNYGQFLGRLCGFFLFVFLIVFFFTN